MKDQFLLDPRITFLNHGSYGACPRPVFEAYQRWQRELECNPVEFLGRRSGELLLQARTALGEFIGASGDDLIFLPNATHGVNTVARSLPLQPGDEVLATDHEYGACNATWQQVCQHSGAGYRQVEIPLPFDAGQFAARMLAAIGPRTRLIFCSHITSTTALIFPVAELCAEARRRGILTLIDGAHAPGQIDLDLAAVGADFYAGNCHKWLCAPKGAGFLHVRPEHQQAIHATVTSWGYLAGSGGHSGFDAYTGRSTLERRLQWQGTRDISACLAVPEAIAFQRQHDWPRLRAECHRMACDTQRDVLARNGLQAIASDQDVAQMVPIPVRAGDAEALRRRLFDEEGIEVPVTQHAGQTFVRVSVQAYNTSDDLAAMVAALRRMDV